MSLCTAKTHVIVHTSRSLMPGLLRTWHRRRSAISEQQDCALQQLQAAQPHPIMRVRAHQPARRLLHAARIVPRRLHARVLRLHTCGGASKRCGVMRIGRSSQIWMLCSSVALVRVQEVVVVVCLLYWVWSRASYPVTA